MDKCNVLFLYGCVCSKSKWNHIMIIKFDLSLEGEYLFLITSSLEDDDGMLIWSCRKRFRYYSASGQQSHS